MRSGLRQRVRGAKRLAWLVSTTSAITLCAGFFGVIPGASAATTLPAPGYLHQSTPAPTNTTIDIGWNAVSGATGYTVTRSGSPAYTGTTTGTHFHFTLLNPGTDYLLTVATNNSAGVGSSVSLHVSTTGSAPPSPGSKVKAKIAAGPLNTYGQVFISVEFTCPAGNSADIGGSLTQSSPAVTADSFHAGFEGDAQVPTCFGYPQQATYAVSDIGDGGFNGGPFHSGSAVVTTSLSSGGTTVTDVTTLTPDFGAGS